jgi:uncharacterized protein
MSAATNKATVQRIYAAMETGDRSVFGAAVSPDYIWRLAGHSSWSRKFEGQTAVRAELLKPLFARFASQYRATLTSVIGDGNIVVAEVQGDVTTIGGERYNNEYCFVFHFENGLIVEIIEYCDLDLIERVLGTYEDAVAAIALEAH